MTANNEMRAWIHSTLRRGAVAIKSALIRARESRIRDTSASH